MTLYYDSPAFYLTFKRSFESRILLLLSQFLVVFLLRSLINTGSEKRNRTLSNSLLSLFTIQTHSLHPDLSYKAKHTTHSFHLSFHSDKASRLILFHFVPLSHLLDLSWGHKSRTDPSLVRLDVPLHWCVPNPDFLLPVPTRQRGLCQCWLSALHKFNKKMNFCHSKLVLLSFFCRTQKEYFEECLYSNNIDFCFMDKTFLKIYIFSPLIFGWWTSL